MSSSESTSTTSNKDSTNSLITIGVSVGVLVIGFVSYYLYSNRTSSKNQVIVATPPKSSTTTAKKSKSKKINKELLAEILASVHDEMKARLSQLPDDFNSQTESEKSITIASIVQRIDADIAERYNVTEKAIQDACEELQSEPEINQMLENLSHVHDEFLFDMSGSFESQAGLSKQEIDKLLEFMVESTAKSMEMYHELEEYKSENPDVDISTLIATRSHNMQEVLFKKYDYTEASFQRNLVVAQRDPLFVHEVNNIMAHMFPPEMMDAFREQQQ